MILRFMFRVGCEVVGCIRRQAFEVLKLDDPAVYVQGRS